MNRMSERELPNLWVVGNRLIANVAKPSHVVDKIFCLVFPQTAPIVVLGFLESPDRRGINLTARTCKTNKASTVVCRSALRCLS